MTALVSRIRSAYPILNATAAVVLMVIGGLTVTNRLTVLNGLAPGLSPGGSLLKLSATAPPPPASGRLVGSPLPAATVTDVNGHRLALQALRGRPLIVNFWATWCIPCRQELPSFAAAARDHGAEGLVVVPVDYEESPEAVKRFWTDLGLGRDLTPYLDADGMVSRKFGVGLEETGLPVTVLVGRNGIVRAVLPGQVDPGLFAFRLDQLLSG